MRKFIRFISRPLVVAVIVAGALVAGTGAYFTTLHGQGAYELVNWYAIRWNDTATNSVTHQRIEHSTSGAATTGFGSGVKFYLETASGTAEHSGGMYSWWTDATGGAAESSMCLQTVNASVAVDALCAAGDGAITLVSPTRFDYLLGSANFDVSATASHTLYTVPTGRSAVVTKLVMRNASASLNQATDPDIQFGCNSTDFNNISASATYVTPTSAAGVVYPTIAAESAVCTAGLLVSAKITTGATASTTVTVDVFGYLY